MTRLAVDGVRGSTLVEAFRNAARGGREIAFQVAALDGTSADVSWAALERRAVAAAHALRALGVGREDRVFLVLPTGEEFVTLFWATLLAGATPAPAYPPASLRQLPTFAGSLGRMAQATGAKLVFGPAALRDLLAAANEPTLEGVRVLAPEELGDLDAMPADPAGLPDVSPEDLGLVQFSSGSTRDPQGIRLSHANILANVRAIMRRMELDDREVVVTWLPLYHDMGLIGTMIAPILGTLSLTLISPLDFVRRPAFWLQVLGRTGATVSVAPQFAYSLCVRKVRAEDLGEIDLSRVRILLNGAEPIHPDAVRTFEESYRPLGLRPNVVTPCYGLGEATLAVSMRHPGTGLDDGGGVVSCGPPMDGLEIEIADVDGRRADDGEVGEILVRGPSVCGGYLSPSGTPSPVDGAGWLHTGDLGFLRGGELHVTGRKKDLIILGGRNLYPQEVEEEAARTPGLRQGRIAAFGARDAAEGTEALVVVAEWGGEEGDDPAVRVGELRRNLLERIGVAPRDVVLVGRNQIPVTTSGKLRRAATRQAYEAGGFEETVFRLRSSALAAD